MKSLVDLQGILQSLVFLKRVIFLPEGKIHGGSLSIARMMWGLVELARLDTVRHSLEKKI